MLDEKEDGRPHSCRALPCRRTDERRAPCGHGDARGSGRVFCPCRVRLSPALRQARAGDEGNCRDRQGTASAARSQDGRSRLLSLGEGYRFLLISGANTGGKTVTLKMCGLFCLMAACGLFVPAAEGTRLSVFDGRVVRHRRQPVHRGNSVYVLHRTPYTSREFWNGRRTSRSCSSTNPAAARSRRGCGARAGGGGGTSAARMPRRRHDALIPL